MQQKNLPFYRLYPVYVVLLPFFFVTHGYNENYGLIAFRDILLLLGGYCLASLALTGLAFVLYRHVSKAAFLAALLLSVYFFFGSIHDFLKSFSGWWNRYSVLLTVLILVIIATALLLRKSKSDFSRANFFLNGLLFIYFLVDTAAITWKTQHPEQNPLSVNPGYLTGVQPCDSCANPDIYFLLFDEYSSSVNLKETFNYSNEALDTFLVNQGFYIQAHSYSNYNFTPFSVASILNMNYVNGIGSPDSVLLADYTNCEKLIKNNQVVEFLAGRNYELRNYSIFDLAGNPSPAQASLLPVKTKLITEQTLFHRLWRDIGWNFIGGKFSISWLAEGLLYNNLKLNNKMQRYLQEEAGVAGKRPRFVYAHFEMPHWPFYYDTSGQLRNNDMLIAEQNGSHVASYTNYLPYTNSKLQEMVLAIQQKTRGEAVIVIMGDHGYRVELKGLSRDHYFKNLNAVYFPDRNYGLLRDSISGVNQFRVVFNSLFKQSFPMLEDTAVFLKDYHPGK